MNTTTSAASGEATLQDLDRARERVTLPAGGVLYRQGEPGDAMFFVEAGRLDIAMTAASGEELSLGAVLPGESADALQLLTLGNRTATATAAEPTIVQRLPLAEFRAAAAASPELYRAAAAAAERQVRRRQLAVGLRRLCGPLTDAELRELERVVDWVRVPRGATVVRAGDTDRDVYVAVSGRLRAVRESAGAPPEVVGDIGPGESVGEMEFFTAEPRSVTVLATRDSELVRFSADEFDALLRRDPDVARGVTRLVVDRLRRVYLPQPSPMLRTIAVLPASSGVSARDFADRLAAELAVHGSVLRLTGADVELELGDGASRVLADSPLAPGVDAWLDEREATHRFLLLAADGEPGWAHRCVARADQVLLVANVTADPSPSQLEKALLPPEGSSTAARRTLVLLHDAATTLPSGTAAWLQARTLDAHQHFRGTGAGEFARLARFLAGRAVGVVLGGGGARGFAHIGVLQALRDAGVAIDMIGGTSMGASIAAQYALGWDAAEMLRRNRAAWLDLEPHKEYTIPLLSILKGRKAALMGQMLYGDVCIEDLWTPYYCVSTNITRAAQSVHTQGSLRKAATASASLPAVVTPVVEQGDLLVDGAILNNLPVDVMRERGAGVVLAVDVSTDEELGYPSETFPTPWSLLRDRLLRRPARAVPNIGEVLMRCTMLGSVHHVTATKGLADFYLRPPLQQFGLMEFTALDQLSSIGRSYTRETVEAWRETPLFPKHG